MSIDYIQPNSKNDFTAKVILAIREATSITSQEIIDFVNSNNRRRARISLTETAIFDKKIFNYYLRCFDFQTLTIGDTNCLFKNLKQAINNLEQDSGFIEKLKTVLEQNADPSAEDWEEDITAYSPANYDDLTYLSIDSDTAIDKIELKLFDTAPAKIVEDITSIHLGEFDNLLYSSIIANPQLIYAVNWREFEYLLAKILETFEYEVELQKGTKDGGIDIIAIKKNDILGGHKYLIQAKKWKNKVGIEPVQRLAFLKDHYNVSKACLVTTSTFTKGAWELAKMYPWQLDLRDYNGLLDWIKLAKSK